MQRPKIVALYCAVLLMLVAPLAFGQTASPNTSKPASDSATKSAPQGDQWEFRVSPYLWAIQVESKVTVRGYSATVNSYFPDIWRNLEGAGMLNFEAQKGRLGFFVNPLYMALRADGEFTRTGRVGPGLILPPPPTRDLTLNLTMGVVGFGGFYQVAK
jgi:hypothetical protein